jgi:hypothetical protein
MMMAALKDQGCRNVLSYVEDIVVVRKKKVNYLSDYKREGPRMSGINEGHRSKPRQDQGDYPDATSIEQKGCTEAHRLDSIAELIHLEASKM